jgi:Large extracellular alpha-helical protein
MRDDYGRLLDANVDDLGRIRTGGDSGDIGGLDVVPTRTVALFSGPVSSTTRARPRSRSTSPTSSASSGYGVAYAKTRVGSAEKRMFVRDAVTADVVLPRFLAPKDRGRVALSLHNVDGQAGDYRIAGGDRRRRARPAGRRDAQAGGEPARAADLGSQGGRCGFGKVAVAVEGPGNFAVRREWDIQVRSAQTPTAIDTVSQLDPQRSSWSTAT